MPKLTLDAAAAAVGTVRQVWRVTRGEVVPNDFYELPPIGQMALPFTRPTPLFDHANATVGGGDEPALVNEHSGAGAAAERIAA